MNQESSRIVIVGGVAGGASAAARARRMNENAEIIMLEKDEHVSFANCGLPYYVGGEIQDRDKLLVATPEKFRTWFNIDVRILHEVTGVNRNAHTVDVVDKQSGDKETIQYDKLILAPGAAPIIPPIEGIRESENIFTLRNVADVDRLKNFIDQRKPRRAVVVGAGFIGLEMVEQLHHLDIEVSLVELVDQVLPPLDPDMARIIEQELVDHGVKLCLGNGLKDFEISDGRAERVVLNDGTKLDADMVVLGIGVRPNTKLAEDAGLEIGSTGGIWVNRFMQTSDPSIYAVGDAVEYVNGVADMHMRIPLAGPANRAGRIAGEHAATGMAPKMAPVLGTAIVRIFDKTAAITGMSEKLAAKFSQTVKAVWVPGAHHVGYYPGAEPMMVKLIYDPATEDVVGAQIMGGTGVDKRIDVIATVIHFGGDVDDLAGLDLGYAPPFGAAKDPVHMAGFVAQNDLRHFDSLVSPHELDDLDDDTQLVDVRNADEWAAGRLAGATWVPLPEVRDRLDELDMNKPVLTYCKGGQRSYFATRILRQHGFRDVTTLSGGVEMQDDLVKD